MQKVMVLIVLSFLSCSTSKKTIEIEEKVNVYP
jgi:hypothetical protein